MANIKFGTDGWRAVIDKEFTFDNVKRVSLAIAKYCYDNFDADKKVIIGYDPRNSADKFASFTAEIIANFGLNVVLTDRIIATPVLAYAAKYYNANAIMFTASHNPPEYLGMKFIPDYAGPATDEITKEIVNNIDADLSNYKLEPKTYQTQSFEDVYIEHLKTIIDFEKIKESGLKINYDGLHGAAAGIFTKILKENNIEFNAINLEPDGNFGGKMPDPKEKYLSELKEMCKKSGLIGLSNDGDGDRFGVFAENWEFIPANNIIAILLKHLKENKNYTGKLVKTVGTSSMQDIFAQKLSIEVVETAVGFKWVGKAMRDHDVIIGGEESGGLSIKGHIPEKDGVIANLLIMEAIAYSGKKLFELNNELNDIVGVKFINEIVNIELESTKEQEIIIDKFDQLETLAGLKIKAKNTLDGLKLYLEDNLSWALIRKSGTEPLLRIYLESESTEKMSKLKDSVKEIAKN